MKINTISAICVAALALAATSDRPLAGQAPPAKRAAWTTSKITGAPEPPRPYVIERVFSALAFDQPVELVVIPGTNRLAVLAATAPT